jgi:hypothetical protein
MHIGKRDALGAAAALALVLGTGTAHAGQRPNIMEACKVCHTAAEGVVRGKLVSVAPAQKSLTVTVGPLVWIVKYGEDLKVKEGAKLGGPEVLRSIPRDREIAVTFTGPESRAVATQVAVKQPYKVAPEKLAAVEQVKALVAKGAGPGKALLVDSRPPPLYADGHLPGAVSLPYAAFKERAGAILPADKGAAVVFYCAGET